MLASDFITKRENICKARIRAIISPDDFFLAMHNLFKQAELSRGFNDDCAKATEILKAYKATL